MASLASGPLHLLECCKGRFFDLVQDKGYTALPMFFTFLLRYTQGQRTGANRQVEGQGRGKKKFRCLTCMARFLVSVGTLSWA